MATFKATSKKKDNDVGVFKATKNKSYDATSVYKWEDESKESSSVLNDYITRRKNGEWMSEDEVENYRSALERYKSSTSALADIHRSFGTYNEEDDKERNDYVSSLSTDFDSASEVYGEYKSADSFNAAFKALEEHEELKTLDLDSLLKEKENIQRYVDATKALEGQIRDLEAEVSTLRYAKYKSSSYKDELKAKEEQLSLLKQRLNEASTEGYDTKLAEVTSKYNRAKYIQDGIKLTNDALNAVDFDENSGYVSTHKDGYWNRLIGNTYDTTYEYINNVDGMREKIEGKRDVYQSDNDWDDGVSTWEEKGYDQLTDDEIKVYNYYYSTQGKEKAEEYLNSIQETLYNSRAEGMFSKLEDNTLLELAFGVEAGLDQFTSGTKNLFNTTDDYIPVNAVQQTSGKVREDLTDDSFGFWYNLKTGKWEDKAFGSSLGQIGYDSITTTSNMLPSILASTAANIIAPGAGTYVGAATLGASAAGNAYQEMLNLGYDKGQARTYSTLVGISEAGLSAVLSGISSMGGKLTNKAISKAIDGIDNGLARFSIDLGGKLASEGLEEGLQEIINPLLKNAILHTDEEIDWSQVAYSTLLGSLSALGMEGGPTAVNHINYNSALKAEGNRIVKNGGVDSLVALANEMAGVPSSGVGGNLTARVNKVNGKKGVNAKAVGKLSEAVNDARIQQNKTDIVKALESKGINSKKAENYANILVAMNEDYFAGKGVFNLGTDAQWKKITGDENAYSVLREVVTDKTSSINKRNQRQFYAMEGVRTNEDGSYNQEDMNTYQDRVNTQIVAALTKGGLASDVKNDFDISDDGKTYVNTDNGTIEVTSKAFVDSEDGTLKVKVNGDQEVDTSSVAYGNVGEALVVSAIVDMGVSAEDANALFKMFNGADEKSGKAYANGISLAFKYGRYFYSPEKLAGIVGVSKEQAKEAYRIGKRSRSKTATAEQAQLNATAEANAKKGKNVASKGSVVYEGAIADENGNLALGEDSLTDIQKASVNGLKLIAELSPLNFHLFQSEKDGDTYTYVKKNGEETHANGWYRVGTNDIYIDLNAGVTGEGTMMYTAAHEISHFIKQYSPEKWDKIAEYIMSEYCAHYGGKVDALLLKHIMAIKARPKDPNAKPKTQKEIEDEAFEDLVCDSLSKMLIDGTVVEAMANIKKKNKGVWNTIKDAVLKLLDKWGVVIDQYKDRNPDAEEAGYFSETSKAFKKLQSMLTEAFVDAGDTYSKVGNLKSKQSDVMSDRDTAEEAKAVKSLGKVVTVERNENGDMLVATNKDNATVMYSERTWRMGGKEKFIATMTALGHGDQAQEYAKYLDDALGYLHELAVGYEILGQHLDADIVTDIKNGKQVLSAIVNNGEYPVNIDLALICKKRVAYMRLMAKMIEDGVFGDVKYDGDAIAEVNKILRKNGFETACLGCFVESRRLQFQTWAETIVQEWNEAVEARNKNAHYFRFADGKASLTDAEIEALDKELATGGKKNDKGNLNLGTGSVATKMGRLLDKVPSLARKLTVDDLLTPQGLTALRATDSNLFSLVKQRYGAASPKIVQDYNPYASEIADLTFNFVKKVTGNNVKGAKDYILEAKKELGVAPKKDKSESKEAFTKRKAEYDTKVEALAMQKYLYSIGGARIQSFSDFMIENVFDYLQIFADLAAKELPMHGYTKEIVALRLFGMSGAKWNGSLIAHVEKSMGKEYAGLLPASEVKNGNGILVKVDGKDYCIAFDDYARNKATNGKSFIQSIGMKDIIALMYDPRYSPYVGNITIGVSDKQIMAMLDSPLFRMVIPYHASGMLPQFAQLVGVDMYNDYTNYQNTTVKTIRLLNDTDYTVKIGDNGKPKVVKNADGKDVGIDTHYAFNEMLQKYGDARKTCNDYLAWCRNEHPIYDKGKVIGYATFNAKFSDSPTGVDFTKHRNYYKLIEDFNTYDNITEKPTQQGAVTMNFPSAENRLTAEQKSAYEKALRDTGIFTEADIKKYLKKADMTFEEIVRAEVGNRKSYNDAQEPKFDSTVKEVEDYLLNAKDSKGNYKFRRDAIADTASDYIEAKNHGISLKPATGSYMDEITKLGADYGVDKLSDRHTIRKFDHSADAISRNVEAVARMDSVHDVPDSALEDSGKPINEIYQDFFDEWGGELFSEELGVIDVKPSSIRSEKRHGSTAQKIASIEAIPTVVNEGKVIFANYKDGTDVLRIVVAAPIKIAEKPYYMGVMVQRDSKFQRLYLHDVVIEEETPDFSQVDLLTTGTDEKNERLFVTTILQQALKVKHEHRNEPKVKDKLSDRAKAPVFYSYMGRIVDDIKIEKVGANGVVPYLKGKGVKDEEIKWSGIEAWLDGKKSVAKAELQEFIAGSQLQIEEVALDNKDRPYTEDQQKRLDEYEAKRDDVAKRLADEWKKITGDEFPIRNAGAGLESAVSNVIIDANLVKKNASFEGRLLKKLRKDLYEVIERNDDFGFDSAKDALRSIHRHRRDFIPHYEMSTNDKAVIVKYCNALNEYNELPNSISNEDTDRLRAIALEADPWNRKIMEVKHEHNEEEAKYMTKWGQYRLEGGKNYREVLFNIPTSTYSNSAMFAHWGERRGVLAHARIQDFVDFNGNKMLFVEELQSDWHNEGHKSGYRDLDAEDKYTISKKMEKFREEFFESPIAKVFEEKISAVGYEGAGVSMMLNYLLDETDYTLDVLRRKGVSFTDSEKSEIDKYVREYGELQKQWESAPGELTAPDAPFRDNYHEYVLKRLIRMVAEEGYDSIGWTTANTQMNRWNPQRKTNREMGIEDAKNPDAIAFEDGYRIEYDQDIPKFLRKYGKKWGATVGTTTLKNDTEIWSMPITDSMKDSVLYEGQVMYSDRVTNKKTLDFLNDQLDRGEVTKVYRAMQAQPVDENGNVIKAAVTRVVSYSPLMVEAKTFGKDGKVDIYPAKLFSPMAGMVNGKWSKNIELNEWEETTFDLANATTVIDKKTGMPKIDSDKKNASYGEIAYYYGLVKGGIDDDGKKLTDIPARYNPYIHTSLSALNDQFSSANKRPELVTVECIIPNSELTSGFRAEGAKDKVGAMSWHSGPTSSRLAKVGKARTVILTRYDMPVRVLPDSEVAKAVAEYIGDTENIAIQGSTVTPTLSRELMNLGISVLNEEEWSQYSNDFPAKTFGNKGKVLYQDRNSNSISSRALLANALESTIDTSTQEGQNELKKLKEYKEMIGTLDELSHKLTNLRNDLFSKGVTGEERKKIQEEATKTANRISVYDKKLLTLEASKPLKKVLDREKAQAVKKQKAIDAENLAAYKKESEAKLKKQAEKYQESRKKSVEGRKKTAIRNKIKRVAKDLDRLLNRGTKDRNVKTDMQETVGSVLKLASVIFNDDVTNEDIVLMGAETATAEEQKLLDEYTTLIKKRGELSPMDEEFGKVLNRIKYIDKKLADVFMRERARLNRVNVSSAIDELAKAYSKLGNSKDGYVNFAYNEEVAKRISLLSTDLDGTIVRDMTLDQLEEVYTVFKIVKHMVNESNSLFRMGKTLDLAQMTEAVQSEILEWLKKDRHDPMSAVESVAELIRSFGWNELKPAYAFERLGSQTYMQLFWDAIEAEGVWARDMEEAKQFLDAQVEKTGYRKWDMQKAHEFTLPDGKVFKLTLQDMMSIYAYSKREQAYDHMTIGGFQFAEHSEYKDKDGKKRVHLTGDLYKLDFSTIQQIIGELETLYDGKAIKYVDAVQTYLTEMGKKGNEVSRTLYGIDIFNETAYFPLMSARDYRSSVETTLNGTQTQVSLKNTGMSKQTVPHAENPIVLQGFDDVVMKHIDTMSKYHAFVLPIENLRRVFDSTSITNDGGYVATKAIIKKVFGKSAEDYFDNYITDLNGGSFAKGYNTTAMKWFSKFKATSVGASLSVIVQQPFAIIRALDMINPKYLFVGKVDKHEEKTLYAEIKKYAPVAIIKEMGGFDVGSSRTAMDYLGTRTDKGVKRTVDAVNEAAMWGAGKADEFGWGIIWKMVKREVASEQGLKPGTAEFFEACGKRFTEIITYTQVYDSVNSRSGMMRSKSDLAKFMTSFMGEPTTVVNMAYNSMLKAKRAKGKVAKRKAVRHLGRTMGVLMVSTILTTIAKSAVYAMRDDDDDEAFFERWAKHTGENLGLWGDLNPMTMLPYARDIVSIIEGWDVERPDMTLIANVITSAKRLIDDGAELDEVLAFIGDACNMLGIPAKNVIRDGEAIINFFGDIFDGIQPTDMGGAFVRGITGDEQSNTDALYDAIMLGDEGKLDVIEGKYKNESSYETAVKKALRENDPRIREALKIRVNEGITDKYNRIRQEIINEGNFEQSIVNEALKAEYNYFIGKIEDAADLLKSGDKEASDDIIRDLKKKYKGTFTQDDILKAVKRRAGLLK